VSGLNVVLESLEIGPGSVPVKTNEIDVSLFALNLAQEGIHPVEVPNDSWTAQFGAFTGPGVDLLHI